MVMSQTKDLRIITNRLRAVFCCYHHGHYCMYSVSVSDNASHGEMMKKIKVTIARLEGCGDGVTQGATVNFPVSYLTTYISSEGAV